MGSEFCNPPTKVRYEFTSPKPGEGDMKDKLLAMYKSYDDGYDRPQLDTEFEFDFYGTTPPVYLITVETRKGFSGYWAKATFRKNDAGLVRIEVHSPHGPEEALEKLVTHLKSTYTKGTKLFQVTNV